MREAYRKKGWAFSEADSVEQCKREGWSEKIQAQKNEGCRAYGYLEVNKVSIYQESFFFPVSQQRFLMPNLVTFFFFNELEIKSIVSSQSK